MLSSFSNHELATLTKALTLRTGAATRWRQRAHQGATDTAIYNALRSELIITGRHEAHLLPFATRNDPPRIWLNKYSPLTVATPTLAGRALIAFTRALFDIPTPRPATQLSLPNAQNPTPEGDDKDLLDVSQETADRPRSPLRDPGLRKH